LKAICKGKNPKRINEELCLSSSMKGPIMYARMYTSKGKQRMYIRKGKQRMYISKREERKTWVMKKVVQPSYDMAHTW